MPGIDRRWDEADAEAGSPRPQASGADAGQRLLVADEGMRREYARSYRAAVDASHCDAGSDGDGDGDGHGGGGGDGRPDSLPDDIHGLPDMARRYPADYTPWPGKRESVAEPRELAAWLPDTNPDKAGPGRWNNCGECARAIAATWHGRTVTAAALADDGAGGEPVAPGWLIRPASLDDPALRGGGVPVVEQEYGRVMRFPSSVSPDRILAHYDQVAHRGFPVDRT